MAHTVVYYHRLELPSESGQTIQVLRDYHALANLNEWVHLFYRGLKPLSEGETATILQNHGLEPCPTLSFHFIAGGLLGRQRMWKGVRTLLSSIALPSIVVCRTMDHAVSALSIRRSLRHRPVKVLLELHETAIPHLVYREQGRIVRAALSRVREKAVFNQVDGIIATVRSQVALLEQLYPLRAPVAVLPNAVPIDAFKPCHPPRTITESARIHLRYAGQLSPWKNTNIMIESLRFLPASVVLDIAGGKVEKENATRDSLLRHAADLGVRDRVNYVGFLQPKDVPAFLAGGDILLLPLGDNVRSRYFTCPMKLFEYAAVGVPMVVTRQPTTASLIEDSSEALMVEPCSARAIGEAVSRLLSNPALARTLAANAKAWAAQYTSDKRASRLRDFLGSITRSA